MKKIYKLTLGAGAVATAAIPAIAVVSCGTRTSKKTESNTNSNTNTNTESKGTTGTHASTVASNQLNHASLSTEQMDKQFAAAKSDLLKRFIELQIADASTTDADFDKNFGDYAVKLLKVIATDENALSATDTANLIETILSKYSKDISSAILPEITKQVPVISKYISDNHLLKGALDALGFDKDSEDSDLLEKLDSNNLNLVKAALFVAKAVESIPKDLTADTTESVIKMIQSLGLPAMVSGLFPNNHEAMAAWAGLLNSGIIQQVGQLLDAIITKGLGNIDFDEVKKDLEALIDNAFKTMDEAKASVASMTGSNIKDLVDKLHIPALIDILKDIATEGIFGINTKITNEIKAVFDSPILTLLGQILPMEKYISMIKTFSGIINTAINPNGGIASLTEANFDATLNTILGLAGATISDEIKGLISKVLFTGFQSADELVNSVKSLVPDSIWSKELAGIKVSDILPDLITKLYEGQAWKPKIEGFIGTIVGGIVNLPASVGQGMHPVLSKGLFVASKEEVEQFLTALKPIQDLVTKIIGLKGMIGLVSKDFASTLDSLANPLSAFASVTKDEMVELADGMYTMLHEGIAASADSLRKAVADITTTISKFVPAFVAPLAKVALNGLDGLTLEDAQALSDFIYSVIPANTPVVSSLEFKHLIFTVLVGNEKAEAYLAQKAAEEKAAAEAKAEADRKAAEAKAEADRKAAEAVAAKAAAEAAAKAEAARIAAIKAADQSKIDSYISSLNAIATVDQSLKVQTPNLIKTSDVVFAQPTNGLHLAIKNMIPKASNLEVIFTVSSDSGITGEYKETISGFAEFKGISVPDAVAAIKQLLADNHIVLGTSPVQSVTTKAEKLIKDYLLANFPVAQTEINALHAGDLITAWKNPSEYGGLGVLYKHSDVTSFAQLKQFAVISVYQRVVGNMGTDMKHRIDALFDALDR